ncbi:Arc family DNA-binding protein [Streptomyces sp. NPDC005859]|uniref:Arc family DNA-binding protein n=1 Tax=Streptomyces sp. NPDC005859 TaxID=3157170 RepID=UPI0033F8175F
MCGSGGFALSAAQVDTRIKAVATVVMYDISRNYSQGFHDSMTDEQRAATLDLLAEQRYAEFEGAAPALSPRGAPTGLDENQPHRPRVRRVLLDSARLPPQRPQPETRITLRLPTDLDAWLTAQARTNRRSLNSEILHRIEGDHRAAVEDAESP